MKPIIYVAAAGQEPNYVKNFEDYTIFHPGLSYEQLGFDDSPKSDNQFEQALLSDFYGVSKSNVLIYDVDTNPGSHFIAFAFSHNIPVIAVSQNLISPGAYWSLAIDFLVKPDQVLGHLKAISRNLSEAVAEEEERNEEIINSRKSKTPQQDCP